MPLYLVTKPAVDALSLEEAKAHLDVPHADHDALISAMVAAATQACDGRDGCLQRALIDQTWDLKLDEWPCWRGASYSYLRLRWNYIHIPLPPLISVESVKYIDTDGAEQTFDPASYHVYGVAGGQGGRIALRSGQSWPSVACDWPEPITIRFRAGYIDPSDSPPSANVPEPILQAIKMIVGHQYKNRESVVLGESAIEVPYSAKWLLEPFVVYA